MLIPVLPFRSTGCTRLGEIRLADPRLRVCPECAGPLVRASGCLHCAHCGWGHCG